MPHAAPDRVETKEDSMGEPRSVSGASPDAMKQFVRGEGSVKSQIGRATIKYGGTVVLKLLVFGVLGMGGVGGLFLGEKMFPRNDGAQYACAAVLGAVPAALLWWVGSRLLVQWSTPK